MEAFIAAELERTLPRLLAGCAGKSFRDRRDCAIIRLFLDTGMRLEGMAGLRHNSDDPELCDVDLRSRVVRIIAKGRREMVLPIGAKTARDIDRYIRVRAGHPRAADPWLWLGTKGRLTASGIYQMIKDRGIAVGLPDIHPHQLAAAGTLATAFSRSLGAAEDGEWPVHAPAGPSGGLGAIGASG